MPTDFIHRFLPGKLASTVLVLHGTGGDENDLLPVARGLAPGASMLSPRGKVLENGNARFFARLALNVFDENEIRARAAELAEWVRNAVAANNLDPARVYALGYSNGANIAAAMMLLHPDVLAGGVLLRSHAVIQPVELPKLNDAPVLILAGVRDELIPESGTHELAKLLTAAGARVDVAWQDADHGLTPHDFAAGKQWFAQHLI